MNKEENTTSLALLFLNDLLRTNVIDKDLFNKAALKIMANEKSKKAA